MWNIEMPDARWYTSATPADDLQWLHNQIVAASIVAVDTETTGLNISKDIPLYWSLSWRDSQDRPYRVCLRADTLHMFRDCFADPHKTWVLCNAKYDAHILANVGIKIAGNLFDTAVMHALLYEEMPHGLKDTCAQILGWKWRDFGDTFGGIRKGGKTIQEKLVEAEQTDLRTLVEYASNDAYGTYELYLALRKQLEAAVTYSLYPDRYRTLWDIYLKTEVPFTKVLWGCERAGAKIDVDYLRSKEAPMVRDLAQLEKEIAKVAGRMLNPNSPDQLRDYFFSAKGYAPKRLTKGGKTGVKKPSADSEFLEELDDPVAKLILSYRDVAKTLSTYVRGLTNSVDSNGRVHTRYNQDVARCLPAGELVLTNRGYIPVEHVKVGDLVITHTGNARSVAECSVHDPKPIFAVELTNGLRLRTTGNHKYKTVTDWCRADELQPGDTVIVHSEEEKWAPIPGCDDYEISSWGRVWNRSTDKILTPCVKDKWGHLKVTLRCNGVRKDLAIHRLVAAAFCGKPSSNDMEVRHLDGIAWNNTRENLVWGTSKENTEDARAHGTLNGAPKLSLEQVEEIRSTQSAGQPPPSTSKLTFEIAENIRERFAAGEGRAELAREFNVSYVAIDNIVKDKTWVKPPSGTSATVLAEKYGVSPAAIRDIWAGRRWDRGNIERASLTQFHRATVKRVCIEKEAVTYGLTVEEDHSHVTGGIVTHNTGRLSSSDPNLQNIRRPAEDPYQIRRAFIAAPGNCLIVRDYEQLEMRLLACAALEPDMIDIFKRNWDIHMGNASLVFNLPYEDIARAKKIDKQVSEGKLPKEELTDYVKRCLYARQAAKSVGFG